MSADNLVTAPANYVPVTALAFGDIATAAVPVSPSAPLPVVLPPPDQSDPLIGSTGTTGTVGPFHPVVDRPIRLTLSGSWIGTVTLKRSTDGGATKFPLTLAGGPWGTYTANANEILAIESEAGAAYYLDIALSSGTLAYRVAQ